MRSFENFSSYPTEVVRALVEFAAERLEIKWPVDVTVRDLKHGAYKGRGGWGGARIWIGKAERFPLRKLSYPGLVTAPVFDLESWQEAIVQVAAHEFQHVRQSRLRTRMSEIEADQVALSVLTAWRERGGLVLSEAEQKVLRRIARQEAREARSQERAAALRAGEPARKVALLEKNLKAWRTRAKRAATAIKKYERRLARARKAIS